MKEKYRILRGIDKWLGSILLFLLGLVWFRKRPVPSEIRSIAMMKTDGIGDLVLVTAAARDLRVAFPGARLILLCGPFNYPLASILKCFDTLICLSLSNPLPALLALRRLKPDVCVDFGEWSRIEALMTFFSRARWTVGFNTPRQYRHFACDLALPHRHDQHEMDNFKSLIRPLGVQPSLRPALDLKDGCRPSDQAQALVQQGPYAVLHLWSGSYGTSALKEWPADRWRAVARYLSGQGLALVLTGGRADWDKSQAFMASCDWPGARCHNIAGLDFASLLNVLAHARLVISVDTGTMHLAAALDAPVISLHGPTSSKRWGPIGRNVIALDSPLPGCGYMNWGADCNRQQAKLKCMEAIAVEDVLAGVDRMLKPPGP